MRHFSILFVLLFGSLAGGKPLHHSDLPEQVQVDPDGHYVLVRCHRYGAEKEGTEKGLNEGDSLDDEGQKFRTYLEVFVVASTMGCPVESGGYFRLYGIPRGTIPINDRFYAQILLSNGPNPILWKGFWRASQEGQYRKSTTTRSMTWFTSYTTAIAVSKNEPIRRKE